MKFKKSASCTIFELKSDSKSSTTFVPPAETSGGREERKQPMRVSQVQVKMDWMSVPNLRNGTLLGKFFAYKHTNL